MCDCIGNLRRELREAHGGNSDVEAVINFSQGREFLPVNVTFQQGRRMKKATVYPNYCALCGEKWEKTASAPEGVGGGA